MAGWDLPYEFRDIERADLACESGEISRNSNLLKEFFEIRNLIKISYLMFNRLMLSHELIKLICIPTSHEYENHSRTLPPLIVIVSLCK